MDPDPAETATSRRGLLGVAGAAGLIGAAAALLSDGSASAAPPNAPTTEDTALLAAAQGLELAARDLYQVALDAGVSDPQGAISVMATNHRSYAEAIAGATGVSASGRNDEVFESLSDAFDTTDAVEFAAAAIELENTAVATHTELLGQYESLSAVQLTASILVVEARHATVLAAIAGEDSDAQITAEGRPIDVEVSP